jgi:hypothetical protein
MTYCTGCRFRQPQPIIVFDDRKNNWSAMRAETQDTPAAASRAAAPRAAAASRAARRTAAHIAGETGTRRQYENFECSAPPPRARPALVVKTTCWGCCITYCTGCCCCTYWTCAGGGDTIWQTRKGQRQTKNEVGSETTRHALPLILSANMLSASGRFGTKDRFPGAGFACAVCRGGVSDGARQRGRQKLTAGR